MHLTRFNVVEADPLAWVIEKPVCDATAKHYLPRKLETYSQCWLRSRFHACSRFRWASERWDKMAPVWDAPTPEAEEDLLALLLA